MKKPLKLILFLLTALIVPALCQASTTILSNESPNHTVTSGSDEKVYGTSSSNQITLESGARAELINFPGQNVIEIQASSDGFTLFRSGTVVSLEDSTSGTILKIPATTDPQTIHFADRSSLTLNIHNGQVMLDDQEITLDPMEIQGSSENPGHSGILLLDFSDGIYIRQAGDTDVPNYSGGKFDGRWACGATSAVMITAYHNRLSPHPSVVHGVNNVCGENISNYGWYVSNKDIPRYGYVYDKQTLDAHENPAYGAYGYIHNDGGYAVPERARGFFRRHGLFSRKISNPNESDIKNEIDKGNPVWASTKLWDIGHIVVIKGYSDQGYLVADPWPNSQSFCTDGSNMLYTWDHMGVGTKWVVTADPIAIDDRVEAIIDNIKVRKGPGKHFEIVTESSRKKGAGGNIVNDSDYGFFYNSDTDSSVDSDHHTWWKIEWDDGVIGWSAAGDQGYGENWLKKLSDAIVPSDTTPPNTNLIYETFNGSTIGHASGITYTSTPKGQGALFQKDNESRIEYPFSMGFPKQGTIEYLIKVDRGYRYSDYTFSYSDHARIFDTGSIDVWWPGAMWFSVNNNGGLSLGTSTDYAIAEASHTLSAQDTPFRFNQWHTIGFSYGSHGQYIMLDGKVVASDTSYTESMNTCGNFSAPVNNPTFGELTSGFWQNNQYDRSFEGVIDTLRISDTQKDWKLNNEYIVIDDDFKVYSLILSNTSPDHTIQTDSQATVYGTALPNDITLESGAKAELINFPSQNAIQIQSSSDEFTVSRSGTIVTFEGSDGTILKIPATHSVQTIDFSDRMPLTLSIHNNQVMLDDQVIGMGKAYVSGSDVFRPYIIFLSNRDGNWEIYAIDLNLDNLTNLTNNPASDLLPDISPDREQIAFVSDRDGNNEIYIMKSDGGGSEPIRLTNHSADDGGPKWSPDGKQIAFVSDRDNNYEIYIMGLNGKDDEPIHSDSDGYNSLETDGNFRVQRLTNNFSSDIFPSWSPDGKQIAFVSDRTGNNEIYIMETDGEGGEPIGLTSNSSDNIIPSFSPDGSWIGFVSDMEDDYDLFIIDINGGSPINLTPSDNDQVGYYDWSPDGTQIAFDSKMDGDYEIYIIDADGTNLRKLTDNSFTDRFASWTWDGQKIVCISDRDGNDEVYVIDIEGVRSINLSNDPSDETLQEYSPVYEDGGGCFIATAAFGSYLDPHVEALRDFRDHYLLTNFIGKALVSFYYKVSPPVADYIKNHDSLRLAVKYTLTPVIYGIKYPLELTFILILILIFSMVYIRRNKSSFPRPYFM